MKTVILILGLSSVLLSCSGIQNLRKQKDPSTNSEELLKLQQEVSLASDRKEIIELRKDTPVEKIEENDELKFILDFFSDIRQKPSRIQSRFDKIVRRKQTKFRKGLSKKRSSFSKKERKDRELFLKKLKKDRQVFIKSEKNTKEARKEFFNLQDEQRKNFFADSRDKRKEFESEARAVQQDTNSYFRDKKKQFREELRIFKRNHSEWKKQQKENAKKRLKSPGYNTGASAGSLYPATAIQNSPRAPIKQGIEAEFEEMNKVPTQPMESQ